MEIGKQIKKYRTEMSLSQDMLAERVYVTRQTISNWETGKNYPDVKSLLLLSSLFDVTLDVLVKGDLKEMKEKVREEDAARFQHDGAIFTVLLLCTALLPVPLFLLGGNIGWAVWCVIAVTAIYYSIRVEKHKKNLDIHTYKEILAFHEGKVLNTSEKNQEIGKRPYQKILFAVGAALLTLLAAVLMFLILR